MNSHPFTLLEATHWKDYALLDSGDGLKLERFGKYVFVRPESQAMWKRSLTSEWKNADAVFVPSGEESGGHWDWKRKADEQWHMQYALTPNPYPKGHTSPTGRGELLQFKVMTTPGRHLGVFPEVAAHWDWFSGLIAQSKREVNVLNLFGYTGLASLAAAAAGAKVTHVDASKKSVSWARENQALSKLTEAPIRWIVDDALKFVQREARRGAKYDGIILDPPKFAPTAAQAERAARGYKDINLLAFKLLRSGGILVTFSCSGGVDAGLFQKIVAGAALDAGVEAQILEHVFQAADHPVSLHFPEGAYLKGLICYKPGS